MISQIWCFSTTDTLELRPSGSAASLSRTRAASRRTLPWKSDGGKAGRSDSAEAVWAASFRWIWSQQRRAWIKGGSIRWLDFVKYTPHVKYDQNEYVRRGRGGEKGGRLSDGANLGSQASNAWWMGKEQIFVAFAAAGSRLQALAEPNLSFLSWKTSAVSR